MYLEFKFTFIFHVTILDKFKVESLKNPQKMYKVLITVTKSYYCYILLCSVQAHKSEDQKDIHN